MSRKKTQPKKNIIPDAKFNSTIIPKLINLGIIVDLYLGSIIGIFFGAFLFLDIFYLPFLVPYRDLLCFLFATPCVSRLPLKI